MTPQEERDEIWLNALRARADGEITESQLQDVRQMLVDLELENEKD